MNSFRKSKKTQDFKGQHPYLTEPIAGVCLQNTYDYSPFGVSLDGRTVEGDFYRRGFGGEEKTEEISGNGNHYTAQFWEYDSRTGRRWNVDPLTYPWQSSCATFNNNPIIFVDPLGLFGSRKEARDYKEKHGSKEENTNN
jgi:hypothetical protein